MTPPIEHLAEALRQTSVVRFMEHFAQRFPDDLHMKDLVLEEAGPGRTVKIAGRTVVNFGSDSFLGLDRDPRLREALARGVARWGTHNGCSRAFASVRANIDAEERIAHWLGTEAALVFPSVTLLNTGVIPGLVTRQDVIVADEFAHNSIHEGNKVAKSNASRVFSFRHNDVDDLARVLDDARPYQCALITVDGVYSMSGELPPLREMHALALERDAVLFVDDAHGTGVLGRYGRGTVFDSLRSYANTFVVGSLSKALSCYGGFIGCPRSFHRLLKIRSNSYIFGGPVPPCYLEAICTALDILSSPEYEVLAGRLRRNFEQLVHGARHMGLTVLGGLTPIVSILIGDEDLTLRAGRFLFERGYYVQSVTFPAVPYRAGVLRVQVNANHSPTEITGLIGALKELRGQLPLLGVDQPMRAVA
jgi:7-keto-8-aminopelargonate synthetase-like enzyme